MIVNFEPTSLQVGDRELVVRCARLDEILPLRQAILIEGTDRDSPIFEGDHDPTTIHLGVFDGDQHPVACATLMRQNDGDPPDIPAWRLRGMATDPAYQRQGIGKAVFRYLQQMLVETDGPQRLWCNARTSAVPFYRQLGWQAAGETFNIPGVGEHVRMIRWL